MPTADLKSTPKYLRATPARGIDPSVAKPIDRKGGQYKAGMITGVSVITVGEALGHGLWADEVMLAQVADLINKSNKGVKSRFTHPSMSSDGLGRHVARVNSATLAGEQVLATQHFLESGHATPNGDLAGYLMDLAEEDPEGYGLSIVFHHDIKAMLAFGKEHGLEYVDPETGEWVGFESPDPRNANNYPHARVDEVRAADAVDEPAANPGGLFAGEHAIAEDADKLAAYALGLSETKPELCSLSMDPERVRGFASRFLHNHRLEIKTMAKTLNDSPPPAEDPQEGQAAPAPAEAATDAPTDGGDSTPPSEAPTDPPAEKTAASAGGSPSARDEFKRFRAAFGERGADYFEAGLSFEAAQARHVVVLGEENAKLKQQLAAAGEAGGESRPVDLTPGGGKAQGGFASKIRIK